MTDITNEDRREMREWARLYIGTVHDSTPLGKVARHVLTTVEAPPLSEELADLTEHWETWPTAAITAALRTFTTRAEQMERDLTEARAEVERLRATHPNVANTRHGYEIRHTMREDQE